jgi:hypothetical protein
MMNDKNGDGVVAMDEVSRLGIWKFRGNLCLTNCLMERNGFVLPTLQIMLP